MSREACRGLRARASRNVATGCKRWDEGLTPMRTPQTRGTSPWHAPVSQAPMCMRAQEREGRERGVSRLYRKDVVELRHVEAWIHTASAAVHAK